MLTKLLALLHSKVAVAAVGAALIGTTGVALAATQGTITLPGAASHTNGESHTPDSATHAHTVSINGTLVSCSGGAITPAATQTHEGDSSKDGTPEATPKAAATHEADSKDGTPEATSAAHAAPVTGVTICVKDKDGKTWHVLVTSNTKINGDQKFAGGDLSKAIGQRVEVQAEAATQPDGSYVAWKVTIQGADDGADDGAKATPGGKSDDHSGASGTSTPESTGSDSGQGQRVEESGIISALGTNSLTLKLSNGAQQTITISSATAFEGMAHQFSDLKTQMRISVQGVMQADHSVAATRIQVEE